MVSTFYLKGWWRFSRLIFAWLPFTIPVGIIVILLRLGKGMSFQDLLSLIPQEVLGLLALLLLINLFMLWFIYQDLKVTRLELSQEGIGYFQMGVTIYTTWKHVEAFELKQLGIRQLKSLRLQEDRVEAQGILIPILKRTPASLNILLTPFSPDWNQSELKQTISRYRPDLVES